MKTKSIFLLVILVSAFFMQLSAQTVEKQFENLQTKEIVKQDAAKVETESTVTFDKYKHDFGTIKESDGKVSVNFTFTNQSDSPLVISKVDVSCGCSAAEWTKEPVAPGKQGYVKATYDPTNRIYAFNKSLTVHSNGNPTKITLTIQGTAVK